LSLLHTSIWFPFIMAVIVPLLYKYVSRLHTGWVVLLVPASLFAYFLSRISDIQDGYKEFASLPWVPSLGISFDLQLDGLSLIFVLLITGIGALVILYSIFYLDKRREALAHFYVYVLLFMGAMLGVVLSDNLMVLYAFWELTSISSFLLIAFWHHRERSRYGALKSMLITMLGGLGILAGFIMLYMMSGTFSIRENIEQAATWMNGELFVPAMLLILLGAFTKSAQFPFHIWLPDAMEAPTPISAYLHSATMVKAGLYLVARLSPVFAGHAEWFWLVSGIGLYTLLYGSFTAVKQTDLKALLAYSTISQLGLIMCLLGLGSAAAYYGSQDTSLLYTAATTAAIFHLINHATFKGSLFMVAGIIDHETGTRDIRKLGGLLAFMPITFTITLIGSFSMAGLPPFNGFLSKEMFFTAVVHISQGEFYSLEAWGILFPILAWIASIFTFIYSMKLLFKTFTGSSSKVHSDHKPHEAPLGMLISPIVLAALAIVLGLFPNLLSYSLIEPAMTVIHPLQLEAGETFPVHIHHWHGWTIELFMTLGVVLLGIVLYKLYPRWKQVYGLLPSKLSLNDMYDRLMNGLDNGSRKLTDLYMTGSVRSYLIYIFLFFIGVLGWALLRMDAVPLASPDFSNVTIYELTLVVVLIIAALAVPFAQSRLTAILITGAVGYLVTLFFVIFRAPDLALTQLIVETVSVALFLLCFYHLPKLEKEKKVRFQLTNAIIAISVGVMVTIIALAANGNRMFESIADYYVEESYILAGGKNIVNVILVDFRGFDTMLEITVLGIASLGIYGMIKLRMKAQDAGAKLILSKEDRADEKQ
jgi:multicomponent Na+:H+ antiporter subunit A